MLTFLRPLGHFFFRLRQRKKYQLQEYSYRFLDSQILFLQFTRARFSVKLPEKQIVGSCPFHKSSTFFSSIWNRLWANKTELTIFPRIRRFWFGHVFFNILCQIAICQRGQNLFFPNNSTDSTYKRFLPIFPSNRNGQL